MKVFVSWSGNDARAVAEALRKFLGSTLAERVTPFVSSSDIAGGQRGLNVIAAELQDTDFGLVILTPSNQTSQWLNFEAGALSKSLSEGRVVPILLGVSPADITGPLQQFQMRTLASRSQIERLVAEINEQLSDPLPQPTIDVLFEKYWPALEESARTAASEDLAVPSKRESTDLLEEILNRIRAVERNVLSNYSPDLSVNDPAAVGRTITHILTMHSVTHQFEHDQTDDGYEFRVRELGGTPIPDAVLQELEVLARIEQAVISRYFDENKNVIGFDFLLVD